MEQVVRCCLENAASVAKTFLTSDAVVVDIKEPLPVRWRTPMPMPMPTQMPMPMPTQMPMPTRRSMPMPTPGKFLLAKQRAADSFFLSAC